MTELFGIAVGGVSRCVFAGPLLCSLRGLALFSGLTQDFVRTGVLDFVLGCFLFAPSGLGLGIGVTCVLCECLDAGWLASANSGSLDYARDDRVVWDRGWGSFEVRFCRSASLFPAGPGSFFWAYPGLRSDWRPGLRPGLFSFAPSGLGLVGVGVGVTGVFVRMP
jgi:hypothetical protein